MHMGIDVLSARSRLPWLTTVAMVVLAVVLGSCAAPPELTTVAETSSTASTSTAASTTPTTLGTTEAEPTDIEPCGQGQFMAGFDAGPGPYFVCPMVSLEGDGVMAGSSPGWGLQPARTLSANG